MKYLNKTILDNNKQHWYSLRDAGFIKNLNKSTIEDLEKVYKEEVESSFFVNKWCMSCVSEMIMRLYTFVNYDSLPSDIIEFSEAIQSTVVDDATVAVRVNDFDADNVNKTIPKKRGRKSRK